MRRLPRTRSTRTEEERRMNIYVGNLAYEVTDEELEAAFAMHGQVASARVVQDR